MQHFFFTYNSKMEGTDEYVKIENAQILKIIENQKQILGLNIAPI